MFGLVEVGISLESCREFPAGSIVTNFITSETREKVCTKFWNHLFKTPNSTFIMQDVLRQMYESSLATVI